MPTSFVSPIPYWTIAGGHPETGQFSLMVNGQETSILPFNSSASGIQGAINAIFPGLCAAEGGPLPEIPITLRCSQPSIVQIGMKELGGARPVLFCRPGIQLEDCNTLASGTSGCSQVVDTAHYVTGDASLKLSAPNTQVFHAQWNQQQLFTAAEFATIEAMVFVEQPADRWNTYLQMHWRISVGNATFQHWFHGPNVGLVPGWNRIVVPKSAFFVGGGQPNWNMGIGAMRLRFDSILNGVPGPVDSTVYVDSLVFGATSKPVILIRFDDAFADNATIAEPILSSYGLKASVFVVPRWVGTSYYCNLAQLQGLKARGWTIGNHSANHNDMGSLDQMDYNTFRNQEYLPTKNWLEANDLAEDGSHLHWVSPNHRWSSTTISVLRDEGVRLASHSLADFCGREHYATDPLFLGAWVVDGNDPNRFKNIWRYIDNVVAKGGVGVLLFHSIQPTIGGGGVPPGLTFETNYFRDIAHMLYKYQFNGLCDVMTFDEYYRSL